MTFVTVGIVLDKGFTFQQNVCNACHDVLMMPMNLSDIAFLNIPGLDYCCINIELAKVKWQIYCKMSIRMKYL